MKRVKLAIAGAIAGTLMLTGCMDKTTEPLRDAGVGKRDDSPADVYNMPDGFSNVATKCDGHGNRIFVVFKANKAYGAITAIKDPTCPTK